MTVVDSSVWIDYLANRSNPWTAWLESNIGTEALGLTDLIFCEVLQGFADERKFQEIRLRLSSLPIFPSGGREIALDAAINYRLLRAKGLTVRKTIDCFIATFCLTEGYSLLHQDRDFDTFEKHLGLQVIHPEHERA
jgi:predicted nucleic acid-binding protein